MSPEFLANLERTLRAFVALVNKLEEIGQDKEFQSVFQLYQIHRGTYSGPNWEAELREAQACLREAKALSGAPGGHSVAQ